MVNHAQQMYSLMERLTPSNFQRVIQASFSRGNSLSGKTLNLSFAKSFASSSLKCKDSASPRMMDKPGKLPRFDPAAAIPMRWGAVYFAGFMVLWVAAFFASPFARRDTMYMTCDKKWVDEDCKDCEHPPIQE